MKRFFVLVLAILVGAISGGIYADSAPSPMAPYPHIHALKKFKDVLKLSDTQLQEIEKVNKSFKEKHKANKDRLDPLVSRLQELEKSEPVDYVAAEQVLKSISEIHASSRLDKMMHQQALMNLLNQEQKAEFKKQIESKKKETEAKRESWHEYKNR